MEILIICALGLLASCLTARMLCTTLQRTMVHFMIKRKLVLLVQWSSRNGSTVDLSSQQWTYQVGLRGESLRLDTGGSTLWWSGLPFISIVDISSLDSIQTL